MLQLEITFSIGCLSCSGSHTRVNTSRTLTSLAKRQGTSNGLKTGSVQARITKSNTYLKLGTTPAVSTTPCVIRKPKQPFTIAGILPLPFARLDIRRNHGRLSKTTLTVRPDCNIKPVVGCDGGGTATAASCGALVAVTSRIEWCGKVHSLRGILFRDKSSILSFPLHWRHLP